MFYHKEVITLKREGANFREQELIDRKVEGTINK